MAVRPLHDGLIIRPDTQPRKIGRIILPDNREPRVMTGVVVRAGKGRHYVDGVYLPVDVEEGERVAFLTAVKENGTQRMVARRLERDGEELLLLDQRDVLFAIEGNEIPELN